ncbi:MAG: Eco57I restriction-modification methylase domain-containing protein, partial [Proteobacteria bacterium]|nr:Eco57I restriction-modification methylase domain-containing protein [Pseudomonadota bacterium]
YFLQKKGWFGVGRDDGWGTGSKHFLRELFNKKHGDYNNFFNDILEPLFYEALRTGEDRKHEDYYYSRFNCKIPFLNGGLFDPIGNYDWVHTDIIIPDKLFSNQTETKEGDKGTGILDVFDRYNFTVKEDEPLEKDVAIDPELLGKSYEKFNAIRPDNYAEFKKALKSGKKGEENKFNKKFGVYYTPREIVHYMCQQSLINYLYTSVNIHKELTITKPAVQKNLFEPQSPVQQILTSNLYKPIIPKNDIETLIHTGEQLSENEARVLSKGKETKTYSHQLPESIRKNARQIDDKLAEITVCDPAVGSGAFPVGMMNEIVKARNVLSVFIDDENRKTYDFKRQCIEHSLYGVDIDPGAVEIAKLRLWLSLMVDEEDIKNIKPLPNLDYRIMQGNSLISEFMGMNFDDTENENLKKEIEALNAAIKSLEKEKSDKDSKSARHYKKTTEIDQTMLNEINILDNNIKKLKNKRTLFKKKLNHQEDSPEIVNLISEFQKKKNTFLNESNITRKSQLKDEVDDLLVKIFETKLRIQKADYFNRLKNIENKYSVFRNEKQRDKFIKQDTEQLNKESGFDLESAEKQLKEFSSGQKIKPFFLWNLYFSEVFMRGPKSPSGRPPIKSGFDVVIANPPYVRIQEIQKNDPQLATRLKDNFFSASGSFDIYACFVEIAIRLICNKGNISYILPHKFFQATFGKNLRQLISSKRMLKKIVDFGSSQVFETATTYTCLLFLSHGNNSFKFAELKPDTILTDLTEIFELINRNEETETDKVATKILSNNRVTEKEWHFSAGHTSEILSKLRMQPQTLADVCEKIFVGLQTSADKIYFLEHIAEKDDVVTAYSKSLNKKIIIEKGFVKPLLKGADVHRYLKLTPRIWSIFPYKIENHKAVLYSQNEIIKCFPMAWEYLLENRKELENREQGKMKHDKFYAYIYPKNLTEFEREKIVTPDIASGCQMSLDDRGIYHTTTIYSFVFKKNSNESMKYYLSLLNSKLLWYFLISTGSVLRGNFFRFKTNYLMPFPIPSEPSQADQQPFIALVSRILALTKAEDYTENHQKQAKVKTFEAEIDQLVYKLYDLTQEEIKIVEGKNPNDRNT